MYNKVILIGRLTKDPGQSSTGNGKSVANFTLAVDRDFKIEGQPDVDFFDISAFSKTAEFVNSWFKKGMLVLIEARLRQNKWTDKDGNKRSGIEIIADNARFAEAKTREQGDEAEQGNNDTEG